MNAQCNVFYSTVPSRRVCLTTQMSGERGCVEGRYAYVQSYKIPSLHCTHVRYVNRYGSLIRAISAHGSVCTADGIHLTTSVGCPTASNPISGKNSIFNRHKGTKAMKGYRVRFQIIPHAHSIVACRVLYAHCFAAHKDQNRTSITPLATATRDTNNILLP